MNFLISSVPVLVIISIVYLVFKYVVIWRHRLQNKQNLMQKRSDMPFAKYLLIGDLFVMLTGIIIIIIVLKKFFL